jgi:hypothetical protein
VNSFEKDKVLEGLLLYEWQQHNKCCVHFESAFVCPMMLKFKFCSIGELLFVWNTMEIFSGDVG